MKNKSSQKKLGIMMTALGFAALISAGMLYLYNLSEENNAAEVSDKTAQILTERIAQNKEQSVNKDTSPEITPVTESEPESEKSEPTAEIDGETYIGILSIPSLYLKWPVNSEWSYQKLKLTPCRYTGTAEDSTLTIAAHNYRYHFAELTKLRLGDKIIFTDINGDEYQYTVEQIETIKPASIDKVINTTFDLTLFTCNYSGDARVTVNCNLIRDEAN